MLKNKKTWWNSKPYKGRKIAPPDKGFEVQPGQSESVAHLVRRMANGENLRIDSDNYIDYDMPTPGSDLVEIHEFGEQISDKLLRRVASKSKPEPEPEPEPESKKEPEPEPEPE